MEREVGVAKWALGVLAFKYGDAQMNEYNNARKCK